MHTLHLQMLENEPTRHFLLNSNNWWIITNLFSFQQQPSEKSPTDSSSGTTTPATSTPSSFDQVKTSSSTVAPPTTTSSTWNSGTGEQWQSYGQSYGSASGQQAFPNSFDQFGALNRSFNPSAGSGMNSGTGSAFVGLNGSSGSANGSGLGYNLAVNTAVEPKAMYGRGSVHPSPSAPGSAATGAPGATSLMSGNLVPGYPPRPSEESSLRSSNAGSIGFNAAATASSEGYSGSSRTEDQLSPDTTTKDDKLTPSSVGGAASGVQPHIGVSTASFLAYSAGDKPLMANSGSVEANFPPFPDGPSGNATASYRQNAPACRPLDSLSSAPGRNPLNSPNCLQNFRPNLWNQTAPWTPNPPMQPSQPKPLAEVTNRMLPSKEDDLIEKLKRNLLPEAPSCDCFTDPSRK